jgi:redox-sensitive bicupin YhaK (pirin superfamily)
LQIWITPNEKGLSPHYHSKNYSKNVCKNELRQVVSGEVLDATITIQQDANIYVAELEKGARLPIANHAMRQSYLFCVEGSLTGNGVALTECDALKLWGEEHLTLTALEESHILIVEMALEK